MGIRITTAFIILLCSFHSIGQSRIGVAFPTNQKKLPTYFSPYITYRVSPAVIGILKVGEPYDSLNSTVSVKYFWENEFYNDTPDTLRKLYENETGLKILVDTSQEITQNEYFYKTYKYDSLYASPRYLTLINKDRIQKVSLKRDKTLNLRAMPVYIHNPTNETKRVFDQDHRVNIIQEVLDPQGAWREMESYKTGSCGMAWGWKTLPSNHILVTKVLKYAGSFKTLARIKFDNGTVYYSEPYSIGVNPAFFSGKIRVAYMDGHAMEVQ